MKDVGIVILPHRRIEFLNLIVHFLKKTDPSLKPHVHVYLFYTETLFAESFFESLVSELKENGIEASSKSFSAGELCYRQKIDLALQQRHPFFLKCDEDCFFDEIVWNELIRRREQINWKTHLHLSPILSAGIPSQEIFVREFFSEEEQKELEALTLQTSFPAIWGFDYSPLEKWTKQASRWEPDNFFEEVAQLSTEYKGVHPIRFHFDLAERQNEMILKKRQSLFGQNVIGVESRSAAYFCNNVFLIPRSHWLHAWHRSDLFVDNSDEVPLSRLAREKALSYAFLKGARGLHSLFNTHHSLVGPERAHQHEMAFFEALKSEFL